MKNDSPTHESVIKKVVSELSGCCFKEITAGASGKCPTLPSQSIIAEIIEICRSVLFPNVFSTEQPESATSDYFTGEKCMRLLFLLENQVSCDPSEDKNLLNANEISLNFLSTLPKIRGILLGDIEATFNGDPAAESSTEVLICYPGMRAIINYRIAHELYNLGARLIARLICEIAHSETGIDIHPGAVIGERFSIDHGTGVVIGATSIIGNDVKIYQGVTLGAKSFDTDENNNPIKGIPRHPILGNGVIVYSNASILGRITIGDNAVIGGNIWVDENVAPGERLIQARPNNVLRVAPKE
ncbi:MAG: serine acetyltransferase [Muribaculaceae bacterium]|nr:serine acetyltransferase [Muribaculaceae bacterium]